MGGNGVTASVTVAAPPSKSVSHRKVIAAGLARGRSRLSRVLESDDVLRTMDVLRAAGVRIERTGEGMYTVDGMGGPPKGGKGTPLSCPMGESGTSCRLLTAVLAAGTGDFYIHGAPGLHRRPMEELTAALAALGASFSFAEIPGNAPFVLHAARLALPPGEAWLPVRCDTSSQFLSGLLLAAPLAADGLGILLAGEKTVSWPYVGLTLQTLEDAGCAFRVETFRHGAWEECDWRRMDAARPGMARFRVFPGRYAPLDGARGVVEGDYSGASYLLAAGAVGPGAVTVTGLRGDSLQGDAAILDILEAMGAAVTRHDDAVTVRPGALTGVALDMGHCPDLVPTVAVLASLARGESTIRGVAHLRVKESDRLRAVATELGKTGCRVTVTDGGLDICPEPARPGPGTILFSAHNDHRMAMSLALVERAGMRAALDDPGCVAKSFPSFWETWRTVCPETRMTPEKHMKTKMYAQEGA